MANRQTVRPGRSLDAARIHHRRPWSRRVLGHAADRQSRPDDAWVRAQYPPQVRNAVTKVDGSRSTPVAGSVLSACTASQTPDGGRTGHAAARPRSTRRPPVPPSTAESDAAARARGPVPGDGGAADLAAVPGRSGGSRAGGCGVGRVAARGPNSAERHAVQGKRPAGAAGAIGSARRRCGCSGPWEPWWCSRF